MRKHWPLWTALILYAALVAALVLLSMRRNQGHLIYAFDDAYIHMSMSKNFALHGVWGVTRHEFTSTSSSPLWTLLLAATYRVVGVGTRSPLVLNVLAGWLAIGVAYVFLARQSRRAWSVFAGLALLVLLVPLPSLAMTGMEHSLHVCLIVAFVSLAASCLAGENPARWRIAALLGIAALLASVRYEGLFVILVAGLLFLLRRRPGIALGVVAAAAAPVVIYGLTSTHLGWFFLPNSLMLKPATPGLASPDAVAEFLGKASLRRLWESPHFLALFLPSLLSLACYARRRKQALESEGFWANAAFLGAMLLHLQFVGQGWTFRHEGYLVALGVVVLAGAAGELAADEPERARPDPGRGWRMAMAISILLILLYPVGRRAASVLAKTPQASTNIYQQQYQMGLFLHRFYEGQSIAANDIGAISYLADLKLLDLAGLASREVAALQRDKQLDAAHVKPLTDAHGTSIAVVYEAWFEGVRDDWVKVGEWKIPDNVICANDTVSFWAVNPSQRDSLAANLRAFAPELPGGVVQSGDYLASTTP